MVLEFSASLPALYGSRPFGAACAAAAADGFSCVELWAAPDRQDWPAVLAALALHDLSLTSVNGPAGPPPAFGTAGDPSSVATWRAGFTDTLEFARLAGAAAVNVLPGGRLAGQTRAAQLTTLRENLHWALSVLRDGDPLLLLEPLNAAERNSPLLGLDGAIMVIDQTQSTRVRLLFDAYHMHQEEPDLLTALERALPYLAHVQLADFPGRRQPGTGTIAWTALMAAIATSDYQGRIGCEFLPTSPDAVSLARAYLTALLMIEIASAS